MARERDPKQDVDDAIAALQRGDFGAALRLLSDARDTLQEPEEEPLRKPGQPPQRPTEMPGEKPKPRPALPRQAEPLSAPPRVFAERPLRRTPG